MQDAGSGRVVACPAKITTWRNGEIGRRSGLKSRSSATRVWIRFPLPPPRPVLSRYHNPHSTPLARLALFSRPLRPIKVCKDVIQNELPALIPALPMWRDSRPHRRSRLHGRSQPGDPLVVPQCQKVVYVAKSLTDCWRECPSPSASLDRVLAEAEARSYEEQDAEFLRSIGVQV